MARYFCKNKLGKCVSALEYIPFDIPAGGRQVCPQCGSSNIQGGNVPGRSRWRSIALAALIIVGLTGGGLAYFLRAPGKPAAAPTLEVVVSQTVTATPPPIPDAPPTNPQLFGVIEVGGKGVKGLIVDFERRDSDPSCQRSDDPFAPCLIQTRLAPDNVNPMKADAIGATANAVKAFHTKMTGRGVDPRQIYIVGSSSVAFASHREELASAISAAISRPNAMDFITPAEESRFAFDGTLALIPSKSREARRREAMTLDIGSGNIKGAYMDVAGSQKHYRDFEIADLGTKGFSGRVTAVRGPLGFAQISASQRDAQVRVRVRDVVESHQGIVNHPKIYLLGGISWALANLGHPTNSQEFLPITPGDITNLYNLAIRPNARKRLCEESPDPNGEIQRVCTTFAIPDDLIAGLDVLDVLKEELRFGEKEVFFMRDSLYAWPLGYLISKCSAERKCLSL